MCVCGGGGMLSYHYSISVAEKLKGYGFRVLSQTMCTCPVLLLGVLNFLFGLKAFKKV